jgi:ADP-ribose pyrophosphatase
MVETFSLETACESGSVAKKSKWAKPIGENVGWHRRETEIVFRNPIFKLRNDEIEFPDGKQRSLAYMVRTDAVIVVPVTSDGHLVLINQYRYSIDQWCLELPAGGTHDKPHDSLEEVARSELREEVGGSCESMKYVGFFFSASSITDEKCHVFLAEGVTLLEATREPSETIKVKPVAFGEAIELARRGEIKDGQSALALLLCEPLLCAAASGSVQPMTNLRLES